MIDQEGIVACPAFKAVDAEAAGEEVAASAPGETIAIAAAEQPVVASPAEDRVVAAEADEVIGSGGAGYPIGAREDVAEEAVVVAEREDTKAVKPERSTPASKTSLAPKVMVIPSRSPTVPVGTAWKSPVRLVRQSP
jgi:hypothetical protein